MNKIYLDPGHGGFDSGAVGNGKRECDLALQIAKRVMALLPGKHFAVRVSRSEDKVPCTSTGPELTRRTNDANSWGADVYVSIHLNSSKNSGAHGIETWHSIYGGKGQTLAQDIQSAVLNSCPGYTDRGLKSQQGSHGDYLAVIRQTNMPAVLVECGFIDSADDMGRFDADKFATGICNGICKYFGIATSTPNVTTAADIEADTHGSVAMSHLSVYQLAVDSNVAVTVSSGDSSKAIVIPRNHPETHNGKTRNYWYVVAVGVAGQAAGIFATWSGSGSAHKLFVAQIK